ncbi:MAG TPA: hypothetical protein DEB56_14520 [Thiobacillus sp.]|nr:hypothetical protein [Thiobacillus sp.]
MSLELETELDPLVTWMRKRGVASVQTGDTSVTLGTMYEPAEAEAAAKAAEEAERNMTEEQRRERAEQERERRSRLLYGPQIRRKDVDK